MPICIFCETKFESSGKMYVYSTGKVSYFCGSKCEKNAIKLGRKSRATSWVVKKKKTVSKK